MPPREVPSEFRMGFDCAGAGAGAGAGASAGASAGAGAGAGAGIGAGADRYRSVLQTCEFQ